MSAQNPILTIDSDGDFSIGGDVVGRDKVTAIASIGTVNGNVFVVNEKTIHNVLPKLCSSDQLQDVSKYLNLVVTSQRFGTKFQLRVPQDMSTAAFCELVKGILRLPASKSVDEMMIELRFEYFLVFRNAKLPPSISLADAGIGDSDELELAISTEWVDKLRIRQSIRLPDISHLGPTEKSSLTDLSELTNLLSGFLDNRNSGITRLQSFERSHGEITQEKVDRSAARYFTYLDSSSKV